MKRLIMISVIFASPMFHTSNIYGQEEEAQDTSVSVDQSNHEKVPEESGTDQPADTSPAVAPMDIDVADSHSDDLHEINLDTLDIDGSGNWLEKRIWYERAQAAFDDVLALVSKVVDMRMQFSNEVSVIGHKIDAFYETVNFDKGELEDKFKEILAALDVEQKLRGDLSEKERDLQTAIKQQMPLIDQLGLNIKSIGDVDAKIDQTLMQAFKTIDECRDYESKAWVSFKAIGKEIDDKKARNIYYEINNFKQNIDQKSGYLSSSLLPYLHNVLVAKIESNIVKINDSIEKLKQKGVDLSVIMKSEQESDLALMKEREKEEATLEAEKILELEREKESEEKRLEAAALRKKQEATWSYKLSQLSNTLGLTYIAQQIESYKYPVASYLYKELIIFKGLMHSSVEYLMSYFQKSPKKQIKSTEQEISSQPVVDESIQTTTSDEVSNKSDDGVQV